MHSRQKSKKTEQNCIDPYAKKQTGKNNNLIVEYVISLSGVETEKIYIKHELLGRGGFANCYITQLVGSNQLMATKIIDKNNLKSSRSRLRLVNEIKIHKTFSHPNIVQFHHYFEDYDNVYIMLELCENESLNQFLKERKTLTTPEVQSIMYGICSGVKYLHEKKFIHRDLKLANIFLNDKYQIKIGDFGLTSQLQFLKENKRTVCGTPNYIAPQVLQGIGYYFEVDIWGIGIIMYTLFYGYPPFQSDNTSEIYTKIRKCQYNFPKNKHVPVEAINLIKSILVPQPEKRPTIDQILQSSFMHLGPGIPLELPQICYDRAPTRAEIQAMPLLVLKQSILKQSKGQKNNNFVGIMTTENDTKSKKMDKSTMDKTMSRDCNVMLTGADFDDKQKSIVLSKGSSLKSSKMVSSGSMGNFTPTAKNLVSRDQQLKPKPITIDHIYIVQFEQIDNNCFYFCTSNYIIGIYDKDKQIVFRSLHDFENNSTQIFQIKLYNNLFSEQVSTPFNGCSYKAVLTLKAKQLIKHIKRENLTAKKQMPMSRTSGLKNPQKLTYITKLTQHKGMIILKLSNKCIQLIYQPQKSGFFYNMASQYLFHFQDLSLTTKMRPLSLASVAQTVSNFTKSSQKSSSTKVSNINTFVAIIGTNQYIKLPIMSLKHIYGIIAELESKKNKHNRNRNSQ